VSISDELKERNILKLILIVRFACATFDVGYPIPSFGSNTCDQCDALSRSRNQIENFVTFESARIIFG
jgi:hypothetical protein